MSSATAEDRFEGFWPSTRRFPPLAPWLGVTLPREAARLAFIADDELAACAGGPGYSGRLVRLIAALHDRSPLRVDEAPQRSSRTQDGAPTGTPCGCQGEPSCNCGCACTAPPAPATRATGRRVEVLGPSAAVNALARWATVDRPQAELAMGSLLRIAGTRAVTEMFRDTDVRGLRSPSLGEGGQPVLWSRPPWAPLAPARSDELTIDTAPAGKPSRIYVVLPQAAVLKEDGTYGDPGARGIDWVLAPYTRDKGRWASFDAQVVPQFDTRHLTWPLVGADDVRYPRWKTGTPFLQRFVEHALNAVYTYRGDIPTRWPIGSGEGRADKEFCEDMGRDIERLFDEPEANVRVYAESKSRGCKLPEPMPDTGRDAFVFPEDVGTSSIVWRSIRVDYRWAGTLACHKKGPFHDYITFARRPMLALAYAFDECVGLGNVCYQLALDPTAAHGSEPLGLRERLYLLGQAQRFGSGALGALAEASHVLLHELIHQQCGVNHCKASCAPNGLAARWLAARMAHWGAVWCGVVPAQDDRELVTPETEEVGLIDLDAKFAPRTITNECGDNKKKPSAYQVGMTLTGYGTPDGSATFCCESFADGNRCLRSPGSLELLTPCTLGDPASASEDPCSS